MCFYYFIWEFSILKFWNYIQFMYGVNIYYVTFIKEYIPDITMKCLHFIEISTHKNKEVHTIICTTESNYILANAYFSIGILKISEPII